MLSSSSSDNVNTVTRKNATVTKRKNATTAVLKGNGEKSPSVSPTNNATTTDGRQPSSSSRFSPYVRTSHYTPRRRFKRRSSSLKGHDFTVMDNILYFYDKTLWWIQHKVPKSVQYCLFVLVVWSLSYVVFQRKISNHHSHEYKLTLPKTATAILERQQQQQQHDNLLLRRNGSSITTNTVPKRHLKEVVEEEEFALVVLMKFKTRHLKTMHYPTQNLYTSNQHDHGGLEFSSSSDDEDDDEYQGHHNSDAQQQEPPPRIIYEDPIEEYQDYRDPHDPLDDDFEPDYVPNEDDYLRFYKNNDLHLEDENDDVSPHSDHHHVKYHPMTDGEIGCRRMAWQSLHPINCNNFHEQHLLETDLKYLGHGDFRQAAAIHHSFLNENETLVYKHVVFEADMDEEKEHEIETIDYYDFECMRVDSLIAERMTHSPRIFNMYGLCGIASYSEFARHGTIEDVIYGHDMKDHEEYDYQKHGNDLTPVQKADYCLQMAKAVADLHGHKDGLIIHEDLKADQFLWNEDQTVIKLNDFSRSVIVMWDDTTQSYCPMDENEQREWRTPEEFYWSHHLTEKVDIHNLAHVFYTVLLGQAKYDAIENTEDYLLQGGKVIITTATRAQLTLSETKLAELILRCQADEPEERPSIFEVVKELEALLEEAKHEKPKEGEHHR